MISRCRLLSSLWKSTLSQRVLNSHATCLAERASPLSSSITKRLYVSSEEENDVCSTVDPKIKNALEMRPNDYLKKAIVDSSTADEIFEVVERHASVMNHEHLFMCLLGLRRLTKRGFRVQIVRDHPAFRTWMDATCSCIKAFRGENHSFIISWLREIEVDEDEDIFELICKDLISKLHDIDFRHLLSLQFMLSNFDHPPPSVEILTKTIPVLFHVRVKNDLLVNNLAECYRGLSFVLLQGVAEEVRDFVAGAALKHCTQFSLRQAYNVLLWCNIKWTDGFHHRIKSDSLREVVSICAQKVLDEMERASDDKLARLLYAPRLMADDSSRFFSALWDRAPGFDAKRMHLLVGASITAGYMTLPLSNQIVEWFLKNRDQCDLNLVRNRSLLKMMTAVATSCVHNVRGSDAHERAMLAAKIISDAVSNAGVPDQINAFVLSWFVALSCSCGIYPRNLLDELFSEPYQEVTSKKYSMMSNLLLLEELLASEFEDSQSYKLKPEIRAKYHRLSVPLASRVAARLREAFGGCQFIERQLEVSGRKLDIAIAMDKNGVPVEIPGKLRGEINLEALPAGTKVVAILFGEHTHFMGGLPLPVHARRMQLLQERNFCPVVLDTVRGRRMPPETWLQSCMEQIEEAFRKGPVYNQR